MWRARVSIKTWMEESAFSGIISCHSAESDDKSADWESIRKICRQSKTKDSLFEF